MKKEIEHECRTTALLLAVLNAPALANTESSGTDQPISLCILTISGNRKGE